MAVPILASAKKKKSMSSVELEAIEMEHKRQELRRMAEQNARRVAKLSAVRGDTGVAGSAAAGTGGKKGGLPAGSSKGLKGVVAGSARAARVP